MGKTGHPEKVYCNLWKPKSDQLRHEVLVTDVLLYYPTADIIRGWAVDPRLRPDAHMTLDGQTFNVELDTGTQSYAKVCKRQAVYAGSENLVLYVALSPRRMAGLIGHAAEETKKVALFTTLDQVQAEPRGEIWIDCFGKRTSI